MRGTVARLSERKGGLLELRLFEENVLLRLFVVLHELKLACGGSLVLGRCVEHAGSGGTLQPDLLALRFRHGSILSGNSIASRAADFIPRSREIPVFLPKT